MLSKPFAFGLLAAGCLLAAGVGGYIATGQNAAARDVAAPVAVTAPSAPEREAPLASTPGGVAETETVIREAPAAPAAAPPAPAVTTAPVGRTRSAERATPPAPREATRGQSDPRAQPLKTGDVEPVNAPPQQDNGSVRPGSTSPVRGADTAIAETTPPPIEQAPPEPPAKTFDELVVSADSVLGLQVDTSTSSETARVEDVVEAHVTRDVKVGDRVAVPSGSRVLGSVTQVDRGGKVKEPARLGVRFHTIVLADGTRLAMNTDTVFRGGTSPTAGSAAKIGGAAIGGAILGAILGGGKGAAIGGSVGAAGGTAAVMAGSRSAAILPAGAPITVRILSPVTVTVER